MTIVSSIDVLKDNVDADMGRKAQVTAYIEYAPSYRRENVCSQIFWNKEGEKSKRETFFIGRI